MSFDSVRAVLFQLDLNLLTFFAMRKMFTYTAYVTYDIYHRYYAYLMMHGKTEDALYLLDDLDHDLDGEVDSACATIVAKMYGTCIYIAPFESDAIRLHHAFYNKIKELINQFGSERFPEFEHALTLLNTSYSDRSECDVAYHFPIITGSFALTSGAKFLPIPKKIWLKDAAATVAVNCFYHTVLARKEYNTLLENFITESGFKRYERSESGEEEVMS